MGLVDTVALIECVGELDSEDEVDTDKVKFADCDDKSADLVLKAVTLRETVALTDCEGDTEAVVDKDDDSHAVADCEANPL